MDIDVKSKVFVTICGIFLLSMPIFLPFQIRKYEVERKGEIVEVVIMSVPSSCGYTKGQPQVSFEYKGKVHRRGTGWGICNKRVGDKFLMKHLDKYEDIFLYPKEQIIHELVLITIMPLFGLYVLLYIHSPHLLPYWLKERKKKYKPLSKEERLKRHLAHRESYPKRKKNK